MAGFPATTPAKRVLMIAYEFPPLAAGGVARTIKFARYLPQFGWQPHVLAPSNPDAIGRDETVLEQLPDCVRIHRSRSWEHHAVIDWLTRLAARCGADAKCCREGLTWRLKNLWAHLAIPDQRVYWAMPSVLKATALVLRHRLDAIYSTSWPYSDHVAALIVSWLTGVPMIADLRDPWTQHISHKADRRGWDRMQRTLERAVCRRASYVITPALRSTQEMRRLMHDLPREKFVTIRNGYDPADFEAQVEPLPGFEIVHAGTFYKSRQPDTLLEGLKLFLNRVPDAKQHTRLRLFGMSLDSDLSRCADYPCVELHGWTAHREVIEAYQQSSVLFLLRHFEGKPEITLPWKAFEYMAAGNHILSVHAQQREFDGILRAYGNATVLRNYDVDLMAAALERLYRRWRSGQLTTQTPPPLVQRFSRIDTACRLAGLLNRAIGQDVQPTEPAIVRSVPADMDTTRSPAAHPEMAVPEPV